MLRNQLLLNTGSHGMKNPSIAVLSFALIFAFGCSASPESALRKNTEALLLQKLNDASSYEFVSIEDLQSLTQSDTLRMYYELDIKPLQDMYRKLYVSRIDFNVELLTDCAYTDLCREDLIEQTEIELTEDSIRYYSYSEKTKLLLDQVQSQEAKQVIVGHKALFRYRANNALGGKELREMRIYSDSNFNLIDRYMKIDP